MKKLFLISPIAPPIGGITRWSSLVMKELDNRKIDYIHFNTSPKYTGNVNFLKRSISGVFSIFDVLIRIIHNKEDAANNVFHITTSGGLALIRDYLLTNYLKRKNNKIVYHIHFGRIPIILEQNSIEWKIMTKVFSNCDDIVAIDTKTYEKLCCLYNDKIKLIPNPVSINYLDKYVKSYEHRKKVIIYCGHIIKTKGIDELIDGWNNIKNKYPDYSVVLVGATYDSSYLDRVMGIEGVSYLGEKNHEETMDILSQASAMILPSYSEGFPNVILEAMALKVPIIATKVGEIPQMLCDGNGILFEPKSSAEVENAINMLLSQDFDRVGMTEKAYSKAKSEYDINIVIDRYVKLWGLG